MGECGKKWVARIAVALMFLAGILAAAKLSSHIDGMTQAMQVEGAQSQGFVAVTICLTVIICITLVFCGLIAMIAIARNADTVLVEANSASAGTASSGTASASSAGATTSGAGSGVGGSTNPSSQSPQNKLNLVEKTTEEKNYTWEGNNEVPPELLSR